MDISNKIFDYKLHHYRQQYYLDKQMAGNGWERHHRFKEDAPSGTALKFGEIIAGIMNQSQHVFGRHGRPGQRPRSEIGYHALRVGDDPGQHTIVFGLLGETVELTVRATNRDCYAQGALTAAKFIVGKPPGVYTMVDVLGL